MHLHMQLLYIIKEMKQRPGSSYNSTRQETAAIFVSDGNCRSYSFDKTQFIYDLCTLNAPIHHEANASHKTCTTKSMHQWSNSSCSTSVHVQYQSMFKQSMFKQSMLIASISPCFLLQAVHAPSSMQWDTDCMRRVLFHLLAPTPNRLIFKQSMHKSVHAPGNPRTVCYDAVPTYA